MLGKMGRFLFILLLLSLMMGPKEMEAQGPPQPPGQEGPPGQPFHCCDILEPPPGLEKNLSQEVLQDLDYDLAVYYVIPADVPFDQNVYDRIKAASLEIQAWYQVATGGLTWQFAYPEIVRVYQGQNTRQFYQENGNWWGSLLPEMANAGLIWQPGQVVALWAQGAGWWAGAIQWCGGSCGLALLGIELFPEFNNPDWSGGQCPDPDGLGIEAWPCTPVGAYAHELGHTLGLPHPGDDPVTAPVAGHSIMEVHWDYPDQAPDYARPWGFLRSERQHIRSNPFMKTGIPLVQIFQDADIAVNLPVSGQVPDTQFSTQVNGIKVTFKNSTTGANLYYWTFGDTSASNVISPTHVYTKSGVYTATLRASSDQSMMGVTTRSVQIPAYKMVYLPVIWHEQK